MSVEVGTTLPSFTFDRIDMPTIHGIMEIMGDVNPVHDDEELVERLGLRGPVNQGPANLAYMMNMLRDFAGEDGELERLEFRFMDTVTIGDVVTAGGTVTAVEGDVVHCDVWLDRDDGVRAVSGSARLRVGG
jgi:3-hydroxybutyryl-CoA dehydratase